MPILDVRELIAGYTPTRPVVGPLSFAIAPGETLGLWGPNGTGKSTILKALLGTAKILSGTVQKLPGLKIAYIGQQPLERQETPLTGQEVLRLQHADPRALGNLPEIRHLTGKRLDAMSGGEVQRLFVWGALHGPAQLVLLDEPTNHLDPDSIRTLIHMLRHKRDDLALMVVSHDRRFMDATGARLLDLTQLPAPVREERIGQR